MTRSLSRRSLNLAGLALAVVLTLVVFYYPLAQGAIRGHDAKTHFSWLLSVIDAFKAGSFYPRWLPDQFNGFGAPVFYFYPPFSSFFFASVDALSAHRLQPGSVIVVATFLLSLISSGAFYVWARSLTTTQVAPTLAAIFYGIAPYHFQVDHIARGAMAEFASFIWIPLIFAGLHRWIRSERRSALVMIVLACTGLFFTHLLTAMLVAMVALPYTLFLLYTDASPRSARYRKLLPLVIAVLLSVGLAASYLIPALGLLKFMNQQAFAFSGIEDTALYHVFRGGHPKSFTMIVGIATLYLAISAVTVGLARALRHRQASPSPLAPELYFWGAAVVFFYVFMMGGLNFLVAPPSPLGKIQFLWRALVVQEFAFCSILFIGGIVLAAALRIESQVRYARLAAVLGLCAFAGVVFMANKKLYLQTSGDDPAKTEHVRLRLSPPEYIPLGVTDPVPTGQETRQPVVVSGAAQITSFEAVRYPSQFVLKVQAEQASSIALPAFNFPGWEIDNTDGKAGNLHGDTKLQLVTVDVPAGASAFTVRRVQVIQEKLGNWISLASILLSLLFLALLPRFYGQAASTPQHS